MLKQKGGKVQTGFVKAANWNGADQVTPPSFELLTYMTVPFPPCTPLSKVRKRVPSSAETIRASWLLRTLPAVTFVGVENVRAPSRENAMFTGEWVPNPSNWTQLT